MLFKFLNKGFPFVFILLLCFFENLPVYIFNKELIKPYIAFSIVLIWISMDPLRFRPLTLFVFGVIYDLLQSEILGVTSLFFLFLSHFQRKSQDFLFSEDLKENWIKFIIIFLSYVSSIYLVNFFLMESSFSTFKVLTGILITCILYPLFFWIVERLSIKFKSIDE